MLRGIRLATSWQRPLALCYSALAPTCLPRAMETTFVALGHSCSQVTLALLTHLTPECCQAGLQLLYLTLFVLLLFLQCVHLPRGTGKELELSGII